MNKFLAIISGCTIIALALVGTAKAATGYFPSYVSNLGVGGDTIISQSIRLLDSWIPGSGIFTGRLFFDTTNNDNPELCVNSGCILTVPSADDLPGGGIRLVASGNTLVARASIPSTYNSGALLRSYSVECGNKAVTISGSVVAYNTAIAGTKPALSSASVTKIRSFIFLSSGSSVLSNTGAAKLAKTTGVIAFISNTGSSLRLGGDCRFAPELKEKFGR